MYTSFMNYKKKKKKLANVYLRQKWEAWRICKFTETKKNQTYGKDAFSIVEFVIKWKKSEKLWEKFLRKKNVKDSCGSKPQLHWDNTH